MTTTPLWALSTLTRCPAPTQALAHRVLADAESSGRSALWLGSTLRPTDPYPDHRSGYGIDFLVAQRAGATGDRATGDWLAGQLVAWHEAGAIRLRSLIWWRQRWTPDRGWHTYTGSWPHEDHVHVWLADDSPSIGSADAVPTPAPPVAAPYPLEGVIRGGRQAYYGHRRGPAHWVGGFHEADRPAIRRIQEALVRDGYSVGRAGADGIYGDDTERAVRAYQRDHGLAIDGLVGRDTWARLAP